MANESRITEEMRKAIGVESEPTIVQVEKEPIRRFAEAIGDANPLFSDEDYAKSRGYRSIIAPPGYIPSYSFPTKKGKGADEGRRVRAAFPRGLNGGGEYELFQTIQAGDVLKVSSRISDIYEREGRIGKMVIIISETVYRNLKDETMLIMRHTGIRY